jgi:glutamyl-tRNA reductase
VVVSATKSPHYTITHSELSKSYRQDRPLLLIDLAIPFDIDKDASLLEDVELLDMDYFNALSSSNNDAKLSEARKMEMIVLQCVDEVVKRLLVRNFLLIKPDGEAWLFKMIYYLKEILDSETLKNVLEKIYLQEVGGL